MTSETVALTPTSEKPVLALTSETFALMSETVCVQTSKILLVKINTTVFKLANANQQF